MSDRDSQTDAAESFRSSSSSRIRALAVVDENATPAEIAKATNRMNAEMHFIRIEVHKLGAAVEDLTRALRDDRLTSTVRIARVRVPSPLMAMLYVAIGALLTCAIQFFLQQ